MTYNDNFDNRIDGPVDEIERILTACDDLKFMFKMCGGNIVKHLTPVLGPNNVKTLFEYIDCIEINAEALRKKQGKS